MHALVVTIRAPLRREDLPGLFTRVCGLLEADAPEVVLCDVSGHEPDLVAVEALTRLQLAARRRGCCVRLAGASSELLDLVGFLGFEAALPAD